MLSKKRSRLTAIMALFVALLSLYAAIAGMVDKSIYEDVLETNLLPETGLLAPFSQDVISIPAGIILAILVMVFLKNGNYKVFISIIGLTSYFFYGYGFYVIQGLYTSLYLIYLAIFALSTYAIIWGLMSFKQLEVKNSELSRGTRRAIALFLSLIIIVLVPVWLIRISPDIQNHIPGKTFGVFVLDLGVIFPAFGIVAYKLFRKETFAYILSGVALIKTFTLCLSVALGEIFMPRYGFEADTGMIAIFSTLTAISLLLGIMYMMKLKRSQ